MSPSQDIQRLLDLMVALRAPGTGCAWDREQTFETIAPYTIEEACEVVDAIERGDMQDLKEELGDLLLQVVFHARIAQERGSFGFGDVVEAITGKLVRRHPHVFGEARDLGSNEVKALWAHIKRSEKADRARDRTASEGEPEAAGLLSDVPSALPVLTRALKLQEAAAGVGFDWPEIATVLDKVAEEAREVSDAIADGDRDHIEEEVGDLLFAAVNLARHAGVRPEAALSRACAKFTARFGHIESSLAGRGRSISNSTLDEMEEFWRQAKRAETGQPSR